MKPAVKPRSGHQPPKNLHAQNKNKKSLQFTRSGRAIKPSPIQDNSDSYDSYESIEDSLYKPTKVLKNLSDTDSDSDDFNSRGLRKTDFKEKHRSTSFRGAKKVIDTDDSSYEDIEEDEPSDSDSEEKTEIEGESDCDSWHSEDMDKVLDSDEEKTTVYPPYNEKAKFGNLKLEIKILVDEHTCAKKRKNRAATQEWTLGKLVPKLRKYPTMKHREVYDWFVRKYNIKLNKSYITRALKSARKVVEGDAVAQYALLSDYANQLWTTNPGSTV